MSYIEKNLKDNSVIQRILAKLLLEKGIEISTQLRVLLESLRDLLEVKVDYSLNDNGGNYHNKNYVDQQVLQISSVQVGSTYIDVQLGEKSSYLNLIDLRSPKNISGILRFREETEELSIVKEDEFIRQAAKLGLKKLEQKKEKILESVKLLEKEIVDLFDKNFKSLQELC